MIQQAPPQTHRILGIDFFDGSAKAAIDLMRGINQRNKEVAQIAPATCAARNPGTSSGRTPANVSVKERATVTAGFANDVEAVNQ
jgi:hypothetical protein